MSGEDPFLALNDTSKLLIKQRVEALEVVAQTAANALDMDALGALGETANKYDAFTDDGGLKFKTIETSNYCCRVCCRPNHELQLHVYAPEYSSSEEVMVAERPCKCGQCCSCMNICTQEMTVYRTGGGDKEQIGYITQPFLGGGLSPKLLVMDREDGEIQAEITSEAICCIGGICCDNTFTVTDSEGNEMGKIVKEAPEGLGDLLKELGTDADNFTLSVPVDMAPEKKASMFAALHLLDYMFFENEGDANVDLANGGCACKLCDCYCFGCLCPYNCTLGGKEDGDDSEEG